MYKMGIVNFNSARVIHQWSPALEKNRPVKNAPGILYSLRVYNHGPQQFIQVYDANVIPNDGAPPNEVYIVAASASLQVDYPDGLNMLLGIAISNSSTAATKTEGLADCWFAVDYK